MDPAPSTRLERWLGRHRVAVIVCLLVLSAGIRIVYFNQLSTSPCFHQHRWDQTDMYFFHCWARIIQDGDWLTDRELHPFHGWHEEVARAHLARHPGEESATPERRVWNQWYGGKRFHQAPLYPYLVALTHAVFGSGPGWVFAWQMVLGCLSNLLIYLMARRLFGETVGVVSGLIALFYAPLLMYEMTLLRGPLLVFATLGLVHLTLVARDRRTRRWWLAAGVGFGLAVLVKPSFLLYCLPAAGILFLGGRVKAMAFLTAGFMCVLAPAVARNAAVGVAPWSLSSVGAITFVGANAADNPQDGEFHHSPRHAPEIMGKTEGRLFPAVLEILKTHASFGSYLEALGKKLALIWHHKEIPNNCNFYFYRLHAPILGLLPLTFFFLAPPALVGLFLALRRGRPCWPLYSMVVTCLIVLLTFGILSRLRLGLVAVLIPFAALTLVRCVQWAWGRRFLRLGFTAAAVVAFGLWAVWPAPEHPHPIRLVDYSVAYQNFYDPEARAATEAGEHDRAAEIFLDSLRYEPDLLKVLDARHPARTVYERNLAVFFASVRRYTADLLEAAGRKAEAAAQWRQARRLGQAGEELAGTGSRRSTGSR